MNKKIKKQWVAALRSGKYKQGRHLLRSRDEKYCCLGVLCDLHAKFLGNDCVWRFGTVLSEETYRWAGLKYSNPSFNDNTNAIALNDAGFSFSEIADKIEKDL